MRTLINYIGDLFAYARGKLIVNILCMILDGIISGAGIAMLMPLLSLTGLSGSVTSADLPQAALHLLAYSGVAAVLAAILAIYFILIALEAFLAARISTGNSEIVQGYTRYLRNSLYGGVLRAKWSCISGKKRSDVVSMFTNDISRIAMGTVYFLNIVSQCLLAVFQLVLAFIMSAPLTLVVILCAAVILLLTKSVFVKSRLLGGGLSRINQEFMSQVTEQMNAAREIKVYGMEDAEGERVRRITKEAQNNQNAFARLQSKAARRNKLCAALIISVLFFVSYVFFHIGTAPLMILIYIFARLWPLFTSLQNNIQSVIAMLPSFISLKRLMKDLRLHAERTPDDGVCEKITVKGGIRFENISFDYGEPEEFALRNLSFTIKAKAITALVGRSGAGKTTVVDLLLGLLIPQEGRILADGLPIDERSIRSWRRCIGYVPQEPFLFNGTIRDNLLRFFPHATQSDIRYALKLADAYEFVERLPQGIDTPVGDDGVRLSGGQRQRIVLARALLGEPEVLVLDEATSSLDSESEWKIQKSLELLSYHLTIIVIAHRLSTIRSADHIVVVEHGRIAEEGNYSELSSRDGYFSGILRADGYIADASCRKQIKEGSPEICGFTAPGESI